MDGGGRGSGGGNDGESCEIKERKEFERRHSIRRWGWGP